ncbi:putative pyridoxine 5'-phosphate oxidase superfamily flavin-nucleotide-binding protein [Bradyrhizobium ottawaense]
MTDPRLQTKLALWHPGEKTIQEKVGVSARMDDIGKRVVRDHMPAQHRDFYSQIPFIALGSVDFKGDAWATLAVGKPGFISSPTAHTLDIDVVGTQVTRRAKASPKATRSACSGSDLTRAAATA